MRAMAGMLPVQDAGQTRLEPPPAGCQCAWRAMARLRRNGRDALPLSAGFAETRWRGTGEVRNRGLGKCQGSLLSATSDHQTVIRAENQCGEIKPLKLF